MNTFLVAIQTSPRSNHKTNEYVALRANLGILFYNLECAHNFYERSNFFKRKRNRRSPKNNMTGSHQISCSSVDVHFPTGNMRRMETLERTILTTHIWTAFLSETWQLTPPSAPVGSSGVAPCAEFRIKPRPD